jgi:hypothetical protein
MKRFSGEEAFVDLNAFGGTREQWLSFSALPLKDTGAAP